MPNVRPLWTPNIGTFYLRVPSDKEARFAEKLEVHFKAVMAHNNHDEGSTLSGNNQYTFEAIIKILNRKRIQWSIEYDELGDDLDTHYTVRFNCHTFTTLEEFKKFCNDYYNEADQNRCTLWWKERMGEIPMPVENDGSFLQENCYYCMNSDIVRVDYKNDNGIESYTPVYGCKYKGKKCKPKDYPPEDK